MVEILVNMSSHADKLRGCHSVDKLCFVFDQSNLNDAKIDLFYLAAICPDMTVKINDLNLSDSHSSFLSLVHEESEDDYTPTFK